MVLDLLRLMSSLTREGLLLVPIELSYAVFNVQLDVWKFAETDLFKGSWDLSASIKRKNPPQGSKGM